MAVADVFFQPLPYQKIASDDAHKADDKYRVILCEHAVGNHQYADCTKERIEGFAMDKIRHELLCYEILHSFLWLFTGQK